MTGILDQVLAATEAGPAVVSEEHDAGTINWVGGVTDPGEMIGCGRYQELRRLAGEGDDAYQERLARLLPALPADHRRRIETAMRAAANRRAGLDTSTGKVAVMVAGKPAWHGLGVNVREATDSATARRLSRTDFAVGKVPLQYVDPVSGLPLAAPGVFGIVRKDTGAMLGHVGRQYKPIQNDEAFDFLDSVIGDFGAQYEAAGSLFGGQRVFMLVHLPKQAFTVGHRDRVEPYAIFTNSHDGSGSARCYPTSERVVCANTLRIAQAKGRQAGISIRHTGDVKARIADARTALGLAVEGFAEFSDKAQALARTPCPDIRHYCDDVLDSVLDVTLADMQKGADLLAAVTAATEADRALEARSFERKIERRQGILDDMLARYESERCGLNGQRGTAWAALNAVTEAADHGKLGGRYVGTDEQRESRRFDSTLSGWADEVKQVAYQHALALAT
jgi:phage/plasmid-like protein (TIGR03299 family)